MKLLLLADINSAHTIKWASSLASLGHEIGICSVSPVAKNWYTDIQGIRFFQMTGKQRLHSVLNQFKPEIVHAHYATRYGWMGVRSGFHPFLISAWGSDIMEFPLKSPLHRLFMRYILSKADQLIATSHLLENEMQEYTGKQIEIIPFGIDTAVFKPVARRRSELVIGAVKSLEDLYGIDVLIKAFALLCKRMPGSNLKLRITGKGSREQAYRKLCAELDIESAVIFTGWYSFREIPACYRELDIFVNVSRRESFGVSVLEAQACGIPVVTSDIKGLKEVSRPGQTGLEVPCDNPQALMEALFRLVSDPELRATMGTKGRLFVTEKYNWESSVIRMQQIYESFRA
ncbi:MAG: glycosyltransferase [Bacteroidia bacterium]